MKLSLERQSVLGDAQFGVLTIDGVFQCYTLERVSLIIPAGTYPVYLTVSQRSLAGSLWSPDLLHRLPLVAKVPGRSGIRIHAANRPAELEGCIAVGQIQREGMLEQSRIALTGLWRKLILDPDGVFTLDIVDTPPASSEV